MHVKNVDHTDFIVFLFTRTDTEPTAHYTGDNHANYYTTKDVTFVFLIMSHSTIAISFILIYKTRIDFNLLLKVMHFVIIDNC